MMTKVCREWRAINDDRTVRHSVTKAKFGVTNHGWKTMQQRDCIWSNTLVGRRSTERQGGYYHPRREFTRFMRHKTFDVMSLKSRGKMESREVVHLLKRLGGQLQELHHEPQSHQYQIEEVFIAMRVYLNVNRIWALTIIKLEFASDMDLVFTNRLRNEFFFLSDKKCRRIALCLQKVRISGVKIYLWQGYSKPLTHSGLRFGVL